MDKDTVLETIQKVFALYSIEWAVVGHELHKDGASHLHACIKLNIKINWRGFKILDSITGKHGNYQAAKALKKCLGYCVKDNDFVSYKIDVPKYLAAAKMNKSTTIAVKLRDENMTLAELMEDDPGFVLMHQPKIVNFIALRDHLEVPDLAPWIKPNMKDFNTPSDRSIAKWLRKHIKPRKPRRMKSPQLWIWGESNIGKTTLLANLEKYLRVFLVPLEDWMDGWTDAHFDLAILDEFTGQKTIGWLNRFSDGSHQTFKRRHRAPVNKYQNIPMIICANMDPQDVYHNCKTVQIDALLNRFSVVHCESKINVLFDADDESSSEDSSLSDSYEDNLTDTPPALKESSRHAQKRPRNWDYQPIGGNSLESSADASSSDISG